jgi:hypothetical protein
LCDWTAHIKTKKPKGEKMTKKYLFVSALTAMLLAACGTPTPSSSEPQSSLEESSEIVVSSSELESSYEESSSSEVESSSEELSSSEITSSSEPTSSEPSSSEPTSSEEPVDPEPAIVKVPGVNLLRSLDVDAEAQILEAYVFNTYHGGSLINIATEAGTVSVSYFSADAALKTEMALVNVGDFINVTGKVMITTGGDQARSKHIMPTTFNIVEDANWIFDGFMSANTVNMDTGFKVWADALTNNDFGVVYTFTGVKFMTVGSSTLTTTGYDYLNYTALVAGKNEVLTSASNYYRIGFYHFVLDPTLFNTTDTYTIQAFMIGTNQNLPWSGTANTILRLSAFVAVAE